MGRSSTGVRAIRLRKGDECVTMDIAVEGEKLLLVSENGLGKRTPLDSFRMQNRGGIGLKAYKVTKKSGKVMAARVTNDDDEVMLVNSDGVAIRINVDEVTITSRDSTGVILMRNAGEAKVVSMAKVKKTDDDSVDVEEIDDEELLDRDEKHFDNEDVIAMDEFRDKDPVSEQLGTEKDLEEDDAESDIDAILDELDMDEEDEDDEVDENPDTEE